VAYLFDQDTLPTGDGLSLGSAWNIGDKPNGGYAMAAMARTMCVQTVVDGSAHQDPVTVTTHYLRPTQPGRASLDTTTLRTGRTFTTATAGMSQGDPSTLRIQTLATFGTLTEAGDPTYLAVAPPDIPSPDECLDRAEVQQFPNLSSINTSTEIRLHPETGWLQNKPSGTAQSIGWVRLRDGRDPDPWALLYFADALPPTMFELMADRAWVPTVELTVHVRAKPAPGWILARMTTRHVAGGRFEEDGELWDSTGRLVAQSRQLAMILPVG
jgi:acyl-CoA thioesterase